LDKWNEMSLFNEEESASKGMNCNIVNVDELKSAFRNRQQCHNFRVFLLSSEVKKLGYVIYYCSHKFWPCKFVFMACMRPLTILHEKYFS
jgi:hypothetical protein